MKSTSKTILPEFSKIISIEKISASSPTQSFSANEQQRAALAKRFGLISLNHLSAELTIKPAHAENGYLVSGDMIADVVQQCVATCEPLPTHIKEKIRVIFTSIVEGAPEEDQIDLSQENCDFEPIVNGQIDLGELVSQHLGISLPPYPRKPGVSPLTHVFAESLAETKENPFVKLLNRQKKPKDHD